MMGMCRRLVGCTVGLLLSVACSASDRLRDHRIHTDRPIIGILTLPITDSMCQAALMQEGGKNVSKHTGSSCISYFFAEYVDAAGARAAPIFYDASDEELTERFNSVNGVLLTGGEVTIGATSLEPEARQYLHAVSLLLNLTVAAKRAGQHVPLLGICLGFEALSIVVAQTPAVLERNIFLTEGLSLPLELTPAAAHSRFFGSVPPWIMRLVLTKNVTSNLHHDGIFPSTFRDNERLASFFTVLSTNKDRLGNPFVSTAEARDFPVYGVQWHPERPQFSWDTESGVGIDHSYPTILAMQYFADFFVEEARKNSHSFATALLQQNALTYNYKLQGSDSHQVFIFPQPDTLGQIFLSETRQVPGDEHARIYYML